jgi:prepilin-type N-terminal cleavage/methylation domain-containing protein
VSGRRGGGEGFSLIELIIAITIMGMAVGAVFGGLGLFFKIENVQGANARIDTEIRNYAESVLQLTYKDCAVAADYVPAKPPAGLTATMTVTYWDGKLPPTFGATCAADTGLQQITIVMKDSTGVDGTLVVGKSR